MVVGGAWHHLWNGVLTRNMRQTGMLYTASSHSHTTCRGNEMKLKVYIDT